MFRILVLGILLLSISVRVSKAFPTHISHPEYFKDRFDFITQNYKPTMKPKPNRKVSLINNFFFIIPDILN